jgi:hypothetical protein
LTPTTTAARQYSRRWSIGIGIGIGIVGVVGALHSPSSFISGGRRSSSTRRRVVPFAFAGGDYSGEVVAAAAEGEEPLTGWLHNTRPKHRPPTVDDAATRR